MSKVEHGLVKARGLSMVSGCSVANPSRKEGERFYAASFLDMSAITGCTWANTSEISKAGVAPSDEDSMCIVTD